jgi:hypothetical protein
MRSIARTPTRVKALYLCRDNIARFLEDHETEGDTAIIMRLDAANEPSQRIDDGIVSSTLRGHVLGSIPDEAVLESHFVGNPDTRTQTQARQSPASYCNSQDTNN